MVHADKWEADDLAARVERCRGLPCARTYFLTRHRRQAVLIPRALSAFLNGNFLLRVLGLGRVLLDIFKLHFYLYKFIRSSCSCPGTFKLHV